ncbi:MAG TPA: hypothetical protein VN750_09950 [Steroidobacteraceae bacterium]|nr:hypothetical protein [Steroidobacteraceae bacterium]
MNLHRRRVREHLDRRRWLCSVVFCDLPTIQAGPVGRFMVQQLAAVAELEGAA